MILCTEQKKNPKILMELHKKLQLAKAILSGKNNTRSITTPDLKLYYRVIVTRMWCWHKNRQRPIKQNRGLK